MFGCGSAVNIKVAFLNLILLTWTTWRAPTNVSKWRMGFNSAFKGLIRIVNSLTPRVTLNICV